MEISSPAMAHFYSLFTIIQLFPSIDGKTFIAETRFQLQSQVKLSIKYKLVIKKDT